MVSTNARHANHMTEQSRRILRDVRGLGEIAVENLGDAAGRLKSKGRMAVAEGRKTLDRYHEKFVDVVAEHPLKSLLVAVGIGALFGLTMRRRS